MAAPPLAVLLPNPLPSSTPAAVSSAKYPYTSLRKSLRLLIDGDEALDELENDISYVYSGYAPISIRLVQCVAQKGGVLSNPAKSKEGATEEDGKKGKPALLGPTRAHPIVGFKGFEDVVQSIPGRAFDIKQKGAEVSNGIGTTLRKWLNRSWDILCHLKAVFYVSLRLGGTNNHHCGIFPRRLHVYGDRCSSVGRQSNPRRVGDFLNVAGTVLTQLTVRPKVSDRNDRHGERR